MNSPVKQWRNQQVIKNFLGRQGEVVSWTTIRVPPGEFADQAPYIVVLVRLEQGKIIPAQLVDCPLDAVTLGLKVRTVLRRVTHPDTDGVIPYGIKVTPL